MSRNQLAGAIEAIDLCARVRAANKRNGISG